MKLAIIDKFNIIISRSMSDFMYECNKTGHISFVKNFDDAIHELIKLISIPYSETQEILLMVKPFK